VTETPKRLYDLVFLGVPEKDEQGAAAVVEEFRKLLTDLGAVIDKDESMGRRRLAYQINKKSEATYHNFLFRADSKAVTELQRKLKLSESILRFLTVRVDEEMRHGQKIARRVKARPARGVPASPEAVMASEPTVVPAPSPAPAPAPEAAAPEPQPES
jgi:small subunit ribosomal protein S6